MHENALYRSWMLTNRLKSMYKNAVRNVIQDWLLEMCLY